MYQATLDRLNVESNCRNRLKIVRVSFQKKKKKKKASPFAPEPPPRASICTRLFWSFIHQLTFQAHSFHVQLCRLHVYRQRSLENIGTAGKYPESAIQQWRDAEANPNGLAESGYPNYVAYPNTDWYDEIYQTKVMQEHSFLCQEKTHALP